MWGKVPAWTKAEIFDFVGTTAFKSYSVFFYLFLFYFIGEVCVEG